MMPCRKKGSPMETKVCTTPRLLAILALGAALLLAPSDRLLAAGHSSSLPDSSASYGWFQRQFIRFQNGKLFTRAQSAIDKGDYAAAEQYLLKALENDSGSNRAKLILIEIYEKKKAWDKGIAVCDGLLTEYPDYVDGYLKKSFLAIREQNMPLSISAMEAAMAHSEPDDPRHIEAGKNLAQLYFKAGRYALATELGEKQLAAEETCKLRMFLAECAIAQTNRAVALSHLEAALNLAETPEQRGQIQLKKGYLHYDLGDFEQANDSLKEASRLLPGKIDRLQVARQLGETALKQKAYEQAGAFFKAFLLERFDEDVAASYIEALVASDAVGEAVSAARKYLQRERK